MMSLQRVLDRLDLWAEDSCMRFSKAKGQSCTGVTAAPGRAAGLGEEQLEGCSAEKDLGCWLTGSWISASMCPGGQESPRDPGLDQQ